MRPPRTRRRSGRGVRIALGWWRIALAATEAVAIAGNLVYVLGFSSFAVSNFFCYFTIMTAMAAVPVLAVAGTVAVRGRPERGAIAMLRTVLLTHLLLSGIVFAIIQAQAASVNLRVDAPWSDILLHYVVPTAVLADWLVDRFAGPLAPALPWRTVAWTIPFPSLWLAFTLWRGDAVGWYPYFFLDPAQVGGPLQIAAYCAVILVVMTSMTAALALLSRARRSHAEADAVAFGELIRRG